MVGLLLLSLVSRAATVPVQWQEDLHIYTHPRSWRPEGVHERSLGTLESTARELHTPVYVVLIQGEVLPGSGDGQRRLQQTTDQLMQDWGSQGLDLSRYSVFSVAWSKDCDLPPARRSPGTVCEYFLNTCLPGTNDLRSERLGMGPREYHHRDQRRPGRLGGVGVKFYPWRISRDLGG